MGHKSSLRKFKKIEIISSIFSDHIVGVPEEKKGAENLFEEIMAENFYNLGKETDIQAQEANKVPNKIKPKRSTSRHIMIKVSEVKDKD